MPGSFRVLHNQYSIKVTFFRASLGETEVSMMFTFFRRHLAPALPSWSYPGHNWVAGGGRDGTSTHFEVDLSLDAAKGMGFFEGFPVK